MQLAPRLPERLVCDAAIQHPSHLVHVRRPETATKEMTHYVQARNSGLICRMESGETKIVNTPLPPPIPKLLNAGRSEKLSSFVPYPEVQLKRDRDFGVEVIAGPNPSRFADQSREVIGGMRVIGSDGHITQVPCRLVCLVHLSGRKEQIEIALIAVMRMANETRVVAEAF